MKILALSGALFWALLLFFLVTVVISTATGRLKIEKEEHEDDSTTFTLSYNSRLQNDDNTQEDGS
jgi:hypothetical protein